MTKTENNVVKLKKPLFYRRFVDDIINSRKNNEHNIIFENLNKYHPKVNLTIKVNPCKFWDTKIVNNKSNMTTDVFRKTYKLLLHWSSRVPKCPVQRFSTFPSISSMYSSSYEDLPLFIRMWVSAFNFKQ